MANLPAWVNDPAEFIAVVHKIWGKRDNQEALRRELAALRDQIDRMRPKPEPQPQFITSVDLVPVKRPEVGVLEPEVALIEPEVIPRKEEPDIQVAQLLAQVASLSQLTQIKEKLEKEEFEGAIVPETLSATDKLQWLDLLLNPPHKAWISAYFINDGANTVEVAINRWPMKRHLIKLNETLTLDQTSADERIERIFYACASGESATLRVVGQY